MRRYADLHQEITQAVTGYTEDVKSWDFPMKKNSINSLNPSAILYEDNHLLVVNKAPGQLVQVINGRYPLVNLAKAYLKKYNKPGEVFLGVVHRLDRPTGAELSSLPVPQKL